LNYSNLNLGPFFYPDIAHGFVPFVTRQQGVVIYTPKLTSTELNWPLNYTTTSQQYQSWVSAEIRTLDHSPLQ